MKSMILGLFLVVSCVTEAKAVDFGVNDLYQACVDREKNVSADALCTGYIAGVIDGIEAQAVVTDVPIFYCAKESNNVRSFIPLFIQGVKKDPQLRKAPTAGIVVALILQRTYPCPKSKT